jgi:3-hydroxyacyl-CoA dehydrogenase
MNTLDGDVLNFMEESLQIIQEHHQGVVIGNQGQNFSAGANLKLILKAALEKDWPGIERLIRAFQQVNLHLKYAARPVVVAPFGLTLGGGCEIALHSPNLQASAETYMGLVELAVGLIPAAGGSKEMVLRSLVKSALSPDGDAVPFLQQAFETIAWGKISGSAAEARKLGFLRETDRISMNRDRLIADAKERVIQLAREGYQKPLPARNLVALGSRALAPLKLTLDWMRKADRISDYDFHLGSRLAYVLCGGDSNSPQPASETYFLDLERETFLSLCGEEKTQARIQYMLENGKPLRN